MSWWMFTRLEAIEGPGQDVRLPQWLPIPGTSPAATRLTRRHPIWLLVKKEMCLQQLPLVLAAFYVLGWLFTEALTSFVPDMEYHAFAALTLPYAILLAMLIGSTASAAERQIGTHEWQVLLPMSAHKQWAVKLGVVFGLVMALALGLPMVFMYLGGVLLRPTSTLSLLAARTAITIVIVVASGSVYVSSLSRTSLRALVMSIPVMFAAALFLQFVLDWIRSASYVAASRLLTGATYPLGQQVHFVPPRMHTLLLIAGVLVIVLRFAFENHHSADRTAGRVWKQVILTAALVTAGVIALAAWAAWAAWQVILA